MITIKNTQRSIKIDTKKLKADAQIILDALDYSDFDLGIWLTTNATIHKYNKKYRNKDKPTDILSFSYYPDLKPGQGIIAHEDEDKNLGDLIISPAYVAEEAKKLGVTLEQRMQRLLVHGICHLLGYDHEKDEDYAIMLKKEMALLKKLKT